MLAGITRLSNVCSSTERTGAPDPKVPVVVGAMGKQPDDRAAAGPVQRMRLVVGGRVEIEREIVRLCVQRHFDQVRFDDLTRQLDRSSKPALRVVAREDPLNWPDH